MKHLNNIDDFEVLGKQSEHNAIDLYNKYLQFKELINHIPKKTRQQQGLIESIDDSKTLSQLFASSLETNNLLFRKNIRANEQLISLWLAKVTNTAKNKFIGKDIPLFKGVEKKQLIEISKLSQDVSFILKLPNYLFDMGILLIYQQSLPGMKLDGTVFTLASGNPVIGISFRYSRVDYFWFTLMHELSHICLHFEQLQAPILDDFEDLDNQQQDVEIQANRLAKNSFVDRASWRNCTPKYSNKEEDIIAFAKKTGIHPAIVAGMLQKEKNNYRIFRKIVDRKNVRDMVFNHD